MEVLFVRERGRAAELRSNFPTITEDLVSSAGSTRILWRWGSKVDYMPRFETPRLEVNPLGVCQLSADKPAVRRLCLGNDIRIPKTYFTAAEARQHFATKVTPLIWRPRSHYAGQNFVVVNNQGEVTQEGGYWSELLEKTNEYRVYVLFGRVLGVDEKIVEDKTQVAWNHAQGGRFEVLHWDKWPSVACWFSTKLAHRMSMHFGAFDLIKTDGKLFMLEVNSSPAMTSVYKLDLLRRSVAWLESAVTANGDQLPQIAAPLDNLVKGYRHYIHPLHNLG
ncbi:MAG TPA: hypothetical protein VIY48_02400 [Candidatus Paceibacterota bacterium]